jgi:hypothetical protein
MPVRLGHGRETAPFTDVSLSDIAANITARTRSLVALALWGLLMSVVISWIARSRERPRPAAAAQRLQHPISTLAIGLTGFFFFAAIAVVSNVFANATTSWKTTTVFVGFALLAVPILGDYFAARHEVSEEGLRYGQLFGSGGYMRWTELKSIRFSEAMKWFRLESESGKVVRLSVMLMGLPTFAQLLLAHAPPQSIEKNTLPVLQTTAEGNPPSVWGPPQDSSHPH